MTFLSVEEKNWKENLIGNIRICLSSISYKRVQAEIYFFF
jgi:hypothetical protein